MDLRYTEDQRAHREAARDFADEVLEPMARTQYDFGQPLTRKEVQAVAAALERYELATTAPLTEAGGYDLIYLAMFIEEISRIDLTFASLANALFFQVWDMAALLVTPWQQQRYGHMFGRKIWISYAGIAAGILVAARKEAAWTGSPCARSR